jgi:hypothetical protein
VNETSAVTAIDDVMDRYFTMWNEVDPTARQAVIAATWSPEASYIDPLFDAAGYEALAAMVAAVHERFPGHRFRLAGAIDAHHARARWDWELAGPGGGGVGVGRGGVLVSLYAGRRRRGLRDARARWAAARSHRLLRPVGWHLTHHALVMLHSQVVGGRASIAKRGSSHRQRSVW